MNFVYSLYREGIQFLTGHLREDLVGYGLTVGSQVVFVGAVLCCYSWGGRREYTIGISSADLA